MVFKKLINNYYKLIVLSSFTGGIANNLNELFVNNEEWKNITEIDQQIIEIFDLSFEGMVAGGIFGLTAPIAIPICLLNGITGFDF